ncbi:unnamed protein product [Trifolium pratense]|uniref:Uncharacterized protein n=1 Tax=Trifolium pratense TaxID=57577 RepID=A0ACB0LM47_TRIPR|nr:unnamed protein product [Trifolium pratense]
MAASCWCRPIVRDSDVAEGMALLLGMEFAKDMLFKYMKINSDSANVIAAFNSDNMQHNYLGTIALECSNLISRFNNIVIAHVRREANQAAHYLAKFAIFFIYKAKFAISNLSNFIWIEETPPYIEAVVAFDLLHFL